VSSGFGCRVSPSIQATRYGKSPSPGSAVPSNQYVIPFLAAMNWYWRLTPHLPTIDRPTIRLPPMAGTAGSKALGPCPLLSPQAHLFVTPLRGGCPVGGQAVLLNKTVNHASVLQALRHAFCFSQAHLRAEDRVNCWLLCRHPSGLRRPALPTAAQRAWRNGLKSCGESQSSPANASRADSTASFSSSSPSPQPCPDGEPGESVFFLSLEEIPHPKSPDRAGWGDRIGLRPGEASPLTLRPLGVAPTWLLAPLALPDPSKLH